jgi:FkbH-like protein
VIATNRNSLVNDEAEFVLMIVSNTFTPPLNDYIDYQLRAQGINSVSSIIDLYSIKDQQNNLSKANLIFIDYDPFNELNYTPSFFTVANSVDHAIIKKTQLDLSRMISLIPRNKPVVIKLFNALNITLKFKQFTVIDKTTLWLNNWLIETYPELHFLDTGKFDTRESLPAFPRIEDIKRNFSLSYISKLSTAIMEITLEIKTPVKKVLLLDCDGTLWKGLIGEQEIHELTFYHEIHKIIKMLKQIGIIICFVTKNDEANIEKFFNQNTILEKEDIYKIFAGWGPKSRSVKEIALELGLPYDSMIFVDDNPAEIDEVKNFAPEINTLLVNPIYDIYVKEFAALTTLFIKNHVTNEDKLRILDYKSNSKRLADKNMYSSEFEYLKSLNMRIALKSNDKIDFNRVSQLLNRTNQFNLTQQQLSPREAEQLASKQNSIVLTFELSDKYSDLGVVCVCLLTKHHQSITIDNINISCRAFGRKLEFLVMREIIELARKHKKNIVEGRFIPSTKNLYCKNYFLENGFILQKENSNVSEFNLEASKFVLKPNILELFEMSN